MSNLEKLKALQTKMDSGGGDRVLIIDQYRKALRVSMPALLAVAEASALCRLLKKRDPHGIDHENNAMLSAAMDKLDDSLQKINAVSL